jgi:hypothetical protein
VSVRSFRFIKINSKNATLPFKKTSDDVITLSRSSKTAQIPSTESFLKTLVHLFLRFLENHSFLFYWSVCIVEGEKTGDGISYASHVKNPNPLKARATTFYDPVHNALDKEAQCAWKEGEGSDWPSVYIQKPFMTL